MRISEALAELNLIEDPVRNWFDDEDIDYMNPVIKNEKEQMKRVHKRNKDAVKMAQKAMGVTDEIKEKGVTAVTKSKDQKEKPVYESLNEDMFEDDYYDANDVMTRAEASKYWDENHNDDPILAEYKSKEEWMKDTEENIGFRDEDDQKKSMLEVTTFNPEDYEDEDDEREAFELYLMKKYGHDNNIKESLEDDISEEEIPEEDVVSDAEYDPGKYEDEDDEREAFELYLMKKYGHDNNIEESLEDDKAICPISGKNCKVFQNKPDDEMKYETWYGQHEMTEDYDSSEADESEEDNNIWGKASFADKIAAEEAEDDEITEGCECKGTLDKKETKAELGEDLTEDAEDTKYLKMCRTLNAENEEDESSDSSFR